VAVYRTVITIASIIASGLIGFWLARMLTPRTEPEEPAPVPVDTTAVPIRPEAHRATTRTPKTHRQPIGHPQDDDKRLRALRAELEAQGKLLAEYRQRIHGTMLAWPDDTPPAHRPEQVQSTLSDVLDGCELPAQLTGFDCQEPPCLAVMRLNDPGAFRTGYKHCPQWNERFGGKYSMKNIRAPCKDGRTETIAIFHMVWDDLNESPGENLHKRISRRREMIESGWKCLPP
jgi:hypothetical protein